MKTVVTGLTADATAKLDEKEMLHESLTAGEAYNVITEVYIGQDLEPQEQLDYLAEQFGIKVCISQLTQRLIHNMQGHIRKLINQGLDQAEIQAKIFDKESNTFIWKIGLAKPKKSDLDKFADKVDEMSEAEKAAARERINALLAQLED